MSNYIFVDVEAEGSSPIYGTMTEFGAVHEKSLQTFHGVLYEASPDPENPAKPIVGAPVASNDEVALKFFDWLKEVGGSERPVFVSDNPAYDWQWISAMFDKAMIVNPFGWSGRRISDFWAGLNHNFGETQSWKNFRKTKHDHNPVNDAMGNVEAFQEIKKLAKELRNPDTARKLVAGEIFNLAHEYAQKDETMVGAEELRSYHYYNAISKVGKFDER